MRALLDQPTDPRLDPWRSVLDWRAKGCPPFDVDEASDVVDTVELLL